jgi:hypothetical protein
MLRLKDAVALAGGLEGARVKRADAEVQWERGRRFEVFVLELGFRGQHRDVRLEVRLSQVRASGPLVEPA